MRLGYLWELKRKEEFLYDHEEEEYKKLLKHTLICFAAYLVLTFFVALPFLPICRYNIVYCKNKEVTLWPLIFPTLNLITKNTSPL